MLDSLDILISFVLIMLVVSLLITIAVQTVSSALNLRGRNLARGITEILKTACPELKDQSAALVDHVLQSPILSETAYRLDWLHRSKLGFLHNRLATVVRPKEVFDALHRLAEGHAIDTATPTKELLEHQETARRLLDVLGTPPSVVALTQQWAVTAVAAAQTLDQATARIVGQLPAEQRQLVEAKFQEYAARLGEVSHRLATQVAGEAQTVALDAEAAYRHFQYWFDVCQERAQSWFATHTRLVTVIFAVLSAFIFQLDSLEIFHLVATNKDVRNKLVEQVSHISAQANALLGSSHDPQRQAVNEFAQRQPTKEKQKALQDLKLEPAWTREQLRTEVAKIVGPDNPDEMTAFDQLLDHAVEQRLSQGSQQYEELQSSLDNTGFNLFPTGNQGRWGEKYWPGVRHHLFGLLCSVALLSLGAPFWFNILKSLTSLRSAVADNIEEETDTKKGVIK